ncbi:MAG: single-stranded-DNA-specific exonuclease RecJ [Clostridiales bacterium]|nr:single-stranded-DNA-specific exonuclease RecJ [Clostridiales bacterium]
MRVIYGKVPSYEEHIKIMNIANECGVSVDTARLLFCRGIDSVDSAKRFLSPGKHGFHNPFDLSDMSNALERIESAKNRGERVLIFGDYDVDGVCATTILYNALKIYGITPRTEIPEREDGYGLNIDLIEKIYEKDPIDLIITVDCGISDAEKIETLKSRGIDVVVTDHHEPPEFLPDCIKINPKISGQKYPFKGLCGAGVAYKLAYALIGKRADEFLDYVALATIADNMELLDENRDIVTEGLKIFNSKKLRLEFKYLIGENSRQITSQMLAYTISPRVNAGGRRGDAHTSLKLFLTTCEQEKFDLAVKLNSYNMERQTDCEDIYKQACQKIIDQDLIRDDIILVYDESWNAGSIGIVASKLVEEFGRPVIIFASHDGALKGSARSVDGVNVLQAITACKDLLVVFGGHSQAAGVTVKKENFESLRVAINDYVRTVYGKMDVEKKIYAEWNMENEFPIRFARELELLEPFGIGNKKPYFTTNVNSVKSNPLKANSPHYSFKTNVCEMLHFNGYADTERLAQPITKTIVFEPNLSVFKGREYLKGYVKSVIVNKDDLSKLKYHSFETQLKTLLNQGDICDIKKVDKDIIGNFSYGTIYALFDYKNLSEYPTLKNLSISAYEPADKTVSDTVILCPTSLPLGYKRVIYLDKPLYTLNGEVESLIIDSNLTNTAMEELSVDRTDFAGVFNALRSMCGKEFCSSSWAYEKYQPLLNGYTFVLGAEVFFELGFFYVKDGLLRQDVKIKNALTNSKLYSKICLLKGVVC